jgi:hypothetical protein
MFEAARSPVPVSVKPPQPYLVYDTKIVLVLNSVETDAIAGVFMKEKPATRLPFAKSQDDKSFLPLVSPLKLAATIIKDAPPHDYIIEATGLKPSTKYLFVLRYRDVDTSVVLSSPIVEVVTLSTLDAVPMWRAHADGSYDGAIRERSQLHGGRVRRECSKVDVSSLDHTVLDVNVWMQHVHKIMASLRIARTKAESLQYVLRISGFGVV